MLQYKRKIDKLETKPKKNRILTLTKTWSKSSFFLGPIRIKSGKEKD